MPNRLNNIPYFRKSFSRRHCFRLGQLPHYIHFRAIYNMSTTMEKYEETMLDYEPEEEANETPSGAEETELR